MPPWVLLRALYRQGCCSEVARCTDYRDRRAQRYRPSCCSEVLTAALALSGHPLDGHHIGRVESVPSVVTQGLDQPVRTYPHSGQRVLVIIEGPATAQPPEQQPDLAWLADQRLNEFNECRAVHGTTLRPGQNGAQFACLLNCGGGTPAVAERLRWPNAWWRNACGRNSCGRNAGAVRPAAGGRVARLYRAARVPVGSAERKAEHGTRYSGRRRGP